MSSLTMKNSKKEFRFVGGPSRKRRPNRRRTNDDDGSLAKLDSPKPVAIARQITNELVSGILTPASDCNQPFNNGEDEISSLHLRLSRSDSMAFGEDYENDLSKYTIHKRCVTEYSPDTFVGLPDEYHYDLSCFQSMAAGRNDNYHSIHSQFYTEAFRLPPTKVSDQLLHTYFTLVNPGFPVVEQEMFKRKCSQNSNERPSLLLLNAMFVAGAHFLHANPSQKDMLKSTFSRRAKALLDLGYERNQNAIIQSALILAWYYKDTATDQLFWAGMAKQTVVSIGMDHSMEESLLFPHERRVWKRLWWLVLQTNVLLTLQYGKLHTIDFVSVSDVPKLKPSDFEYCGDDTRVEYVIQLTDLCFHLQPALHNQLEHGDQGSRSEIYDRNLAD